MILLEEVALRVMKIRSLAGDDEASHSHEDRLWQEVLEAIANGAPNPEALAIAALTTTKIKFARWCA